MRDSIIYALFLIFFALPGRVDANQCPNINHQQMLTSGPVTDPETVGRVISYLVVDHNYDAAHLDGKYRDGELVIERDPVG